MLEYYSIIIVIGVCSMLIMLAVLFLDETLPKVNARWFIIVFITLICASITEWIVIYLEYINSNLILLNTIAMATVFFVTTSIPVLFAWAVDEVKSTKFRVIIFTALFFNFMLPFSTFYTNAIFYYDENNVYNRGNYFILYIFAMLFSFFILFVNTYKISRKFQNRNNYILGIILALIFSSIYIHFSFGYIYIMWIGASIAFSMLYIYYSSLVNQTDVLTTLLNRRCYENKLYDLKTDATILMLDVNYFKMINDVHGHSFGDYCLSEIGKTIKSVYGKYGLCYRVGGDEFCVVLIDKTIHIDILNKTFQEQLSNIHSEIPLPTVSIGYSYFYYGISSIHEILDNADKMMYENKRKYK